MPTFKITPKLDATALNNGIKSASLMTMASKAALVSTPPVVSSANTAIDVKAITAVILAIAAALFLKLKKISFNLLIL